MLNNKRIDQITLIELISWQNIIEDRTGPRIGTEIIMDIQIE